MQLLYNGVYRSHIFLLTVHCEIGKSWLATHLSFQQFHFHFVIFFRLVSIIMANTKNGKNIFEIKYKNRAHFMEVNLDKFSINDFYNNGKYYLVIKIISVVILTE